jgi:osmotically-inducible protein OsmY
MSTATISGHDLRVRDNVLRQLEREPDLDASAIGVAASKGVVTLTGSTDTSRQRAAAERAASSAPGVTRIVNQIAVTPVEPVDDVC